MGYKKLHEFKIHSRPRLAGLVVTILSSVVGNLSTTKWVAGSTSTHSTGSAPKLLNVVYFDGSCVAVSSSETGVLSKSTQFVGTSDAIADVVGTMALGQKISGTISADAIGGGVL